MTCANCSAELAPTDFACQRCGHPVGRPTPRAPQAADGNPPTAVAAPVAAPPVDVAGAGCDHGASTPGLPICDLCGAAIPSTAPPRSAVVSGGVILELPWGEHRLGPGEAVDIGRDVGPWQRILQPFDTISRRHATLRVSATGLLLLRDHGSTNGSFVNGTRCLATGEQEVPDGAVLKFSSRLELRTRRAP